MVLRLAVEDVSPSSVKMCLRLAVEDVSSSSVKMCLRLAVEDVSSSSVRLKMSSLWFKMSQMNLIHKHLLEASYLLAKYLLP